MAIFCIKVQKMFLGQMSEMVILHLIIIVWFFITPTFFASTTIVSILRFEHQQTQSNISAIIFLKIMTVPQLLLKTKTTKSNATYQARISDLSSQCGIHQLPNLYEKFAYYSIAGPKKKQAVLLHSKRHNNRGIKSNYILQTFYIRSVIYLQLQVLWWKGVCLFRFPK